MCFFAQQAQAGTKTWDGSASGNWGTAANWTGGVAPVPGDDLVFPAGAARFNITNNMGLLPLRSLAFSGSNYVVRGIGITLTNGLIASSLSKTNTIEVDITISSNQTFSVTSAGVLEILGDMVLNGASLTISNHSTNTRLAGVISGSGGLTKVGAGTLTLSGTNANTFSGITTVSGGLLALDKSFNNGAIPANMTISSLGSATVRHLRSDQIANGAVISVGVNGVLDLNGFTDIIGGLTLTSGLAESGTGAIRLNGNLTVNASATPANITGELELFGSALRAFSVSGGTASPDLLISAQITGGGGFIKSGSGEVELAGANSYLGLTMINSGSVRISHASGLGTNATGTALAGGDLFIEGVSVIGEPLTNNSFASVLHGSTTRTGLWSGSIILNTNLTISTSSNALLNLSGPISGSGGIIKVGAGPLRFSGGSANTYTGGTTVRGTLELGKVSPTTALPAALTVGDGSPNVNRDVVRLLDANQMSAVSDVLINRSGLLDLNNHSDGFGSISGEGNITLGGGTLGTSSASGTNVFSGSITGSGGLTKSGAGKAILSGSNGYSGLTIVGSGILEVNGSQPTSAVQVNSGARLQGTGVVGSINPNGNAFVIAPGDGPGILTCSNFIGGGTGAVEIELNGNSPGSYDQINARGTVQLTGLSLSLSLNFQSSLSNQFVILNNDGADAISGNFSSKPEGSLISAGGETFRISYLGGDGNDAVLTQVSGVFRPILNLERAAPNAVRLFWSTNNADSFALESNTNLAGTNWVAVSPGPTQQGAIYTVTNTITASPNFYRLRK